MMIEFHADDYGLFISQSKRILACHTEGVLNGISVLVNGDALQECLDLIRPVADELSVSVHLNFLQGRSLCSREETDLLTDEYGVFNISFARLLAVSFLPARARYRRQLKEEIRAQIHALLPFLKETGKRIRIDGHAHWHMLPVVFDALMDVIGEEELDVEYIRIPGEQLPVLLKKLPSILPFNPITIVKMLLLKMMAYHLHRYDDIFAPNLFSFRVNSGVHPVRNGGVRIGRRPAEKGRVLSVGDLAARLFAHRLSGLPRGVIDRRSAFGLPLRPVGLPQDRRAVLTVFR